MSKIRKFLIIIIYMDKGKISNIISYLQTFQLIEQLLAENIVVNKSPIEIRVQDKSFHPKDSYMCFLKGCLESKIDFVIQNSLNCTHGLTMMK